MDSDTPLESTFSVDEGLDEDVDYPYSSLLSMGSPSESTSMLIISAVIFLLDLQLGLAHCHVATVSCANKLLRIYVFLEQRAPFFVNWKYFNIL